MPSSSGTASARLRGLRIFLGVSGGIAAYKAAILVRLLKKADAEVVVAMTESASRFIGKVTLETLSGNPVVDSLWEPALERELGAVEHVGLVGWAHFALLAPATMNSLGKLARGLADDPVSTFLGAFDPARTLLAPAMNTGMWRDGATRENMEILRERGCRVVGPETGELACGDVDEGRMAQPEAILAALETLAGARAGAMAGKRVLVSAGPTREALDPVRYLSNPSTGTMGRALAEAAWLAGAEVTLVAGPGVEPTLEAIERVDVTTSAEMASAIFERAADMDYTFMAAAVADWRPASISTEKIKKSGEPLSLELEPTEDILLALRRRGEGGFRIGFAMETGDAEAHALDKLERKGLGLIVANDISEPGAGFGTGTNRVTVLGPDGFREEYPLMNKVDLARRLVELAARRG